MSFEQIGTYNAGVIGAKSSAPAAGGTPIMDADGIASGGSSICRSINSRTPGNYD